MTLKDESKISTFIHNDNYEINSFRSNEWGFDINISSVEDNNQNCIQNAESNNFKELININQS